MPGKEDIQVQVLEDPKALAASAAEHFAALAGQAIAATGRFSVALSGGSTPEAMHRLLAQAPLKDQVDWPRVHVFWGDERFVPPDDPASTIRMARETLLDHIPLLAENIHPVPTSGLTPAAAAQQYAQTIIDFFGPGKPQFDLILLGMGPDGHTASLFPGHPEVTSPGEQLVAAVSNAPKPPPVRITMTYDLINQAANIIFLVAGAGKAQAVARIFGDDYDPVQTPAQGIRPVEGRLLWLLDNEAAQELT